MKRTMARAFERITRSSMRSLKPGAKLNENGISFARMKNGEGAGWIAKIIRDEKPAKVSIDVTNAPDPIYAAIWRLQLARCCLGAGPVLVNSGRGTNTLAPEGHPRP